MHCTGPARPDLSRAVNVSAAGLSAPPEAAPHCPAPSAACLVPLPGSRLSFSPLSQRSQRSGREVVAHTRYFSPGPGRRSLASCAPSSGASSTSDRPTPRPTPRPLPGRGRNDPGGTGRSDAGISDLESPTYHDSTAVLYDLTRKCSPLLDRGMTAACSAPGLLLLQDGHHAAGQRPRGRGGPLPLRRPRQPR